MYGQEIYRKVKEIIDNRRAEAIATSEERNREVALLSEDIRIIDAELRQTGLRLFRAACEGSDITPIRERNLFLCEQRRRALVKLGKPEDYTEIKYTCPECSDSGYVGTRMCKCMRELIVTENIKASGMGRLIERQSFDNFDLDRYKKNPEGYERMKANLEAAKDFVENVDKGRTLLLIGSTGTGKTHLSTAIAKAVIERGWTVIYDSTQNIISSFETDKFRSGYSQREPESNKYLECDLLILDDLGTEFSSQFSVSCIYNLINTRQNKGLSTVISTNLTAKALAGKYEDRIYSRLIGIDSRILPFSGTDSRIG